MSAPFTSHLRDGERLIWSASISERLVRADQARQRLIAIGVFIPSTLVAAMLAAAFLGSIAPRDAFGPDVMLAPIYLALSLAIAVLAISQLFKLARPRRPEATSYAATSERLIALDASGAIAAEMPAGEVGDILAGGPRLDLAVLRRDEASPAAAFTIRFIERPLDAKATIEDAYPAPLIEEPATAVEQAP